MNKWSLCRYIGIMHRAGLNRGVPMGRSTQITGGSFRRGLNSEVVTTRLTVQPSPLYKSNREKSKMAASYFCIVPSDWPEWIYSSIQVGLYGIMSMAYLHGSCFSCSVSSEEGSHMTFFEVQIQSIHSNFTILVNFPQVLYWDASWQVRIIYKAKKTYLSLQTIYYHISYFLST